MVICRSGGFGMTPGQLVKAVALALDVPEETVVQHDRNLVVAGLRTKGGRGRSAPAVTALDAARLLVAVLGSVRAKDSVSVVRYFEEARFRKPRRDVTVPDIGDDLFREKFSDPAIDALPANHNFVEGVAALIGDATLPIGEDDKYLRRFVPLIIECDPSFSFSTARIGRLGGGGAAGYDRQDPAQSVKPEKGPTEPRPHHIRYAWFFGIRQRREVMGTAIMLLGKAFRDGGLPFGSTRDALADLYGTTTKAKAKSKKKAA
jgi:hypothetical protein